MLIIALGIAGLFICTDGFFAAPYLCLKMAARRVTGWWIAGELPVAAAGVALGCCLSVVVYPYSPTVRIVGFPFMSMAWEISDGRWLDFVGPLTLPAAAGNFVAGFLIPHSLFAGIVRRHLSQAVSDTRPGAAP